MRAKYIIICISVVISSCSPASKLVYLDEWDGMYKLKEFNSCCQESTSVRLDLKRLAQNKYDWKLFWSDNNLSDTLVGKAVYEEKTLKFFVENIDIANKYFVKSVKKNKPIFRIEYDNYYSEGETLHVDYFTRWYNEMKNYKSQNKLFAGVHYHFKSDSREKKLLPKHH